MSVIYKYTVEMAETFTVALPSGSRFLDVQLQDRKPQMWVLHNRAYGPRTYHFHVFGTGHEIDPDLEGALAHVGTWQDGPLVWHLFVELP